MTDLDTHTRALEAYTKLMSLVIIDPADEALRLVLLGDDGSDLDAAQAHFVATITPLVEAIDQDPYSREAMTELLLSHSLCPIHRIDYAICFDDEDPECSQVRAIHPAHDT